MEENSEKVLKVRDLSVSLSGENIIDNLNFDVTRGEYLTIIGPNGSGKTTLFRALIGIVPHRGEITWAKDVILGYVPQRLDLERNVPLSLRDFLVSKTGGHAGILDQYLTMVHLQPELLKKTLGELSGGEFQRALVAFALMGDTNVLLFDEPTASVDKPSEEQIYETLHRLQHERGLTIITISHDLSLVSRYADKVLCLNREAACFGIPSEVMRPEILTKLYGRGHAKLYQHAHETNHNHNAGN